MSVPFGTTMTREQQKVLNFLRKRRRCVRCTLDFTELENIGAHECNHYHPLVALCDARGHYLCCGRAANTQGCVRADHTDGSGDKMVRCNDELYLQVSSDQALLMASIAKKELREIKRPTWQLDATTGMWNVPRVDVQTRARKLNNCV